LCYFCNVTWVFLIIAALIAALAGRKRGRITPIILALIPLGFGYFVLPVLGFILAVIELIVLLFLKKPKYTL